MKRILTILMFVLFITNITSAQNNKHGLYVGGGIGHIDSKAKLPKNLYRTDISDKFGIFVGYKYRISPNHTSHFFDLDAIIGTKNWKYYHVSAETPPSTYESSNQYYHLSIGGTFNYKIYKGFNGGIGIEPTLFFYEDGTKGKNKFDTPLIGKVGYDFGKFEIGAQYKYGLTNVMKSEYIKSGKFRDIQLSLFIPF